LSTVLPSHFGVPWHHSLFSLVVHLIWDTLRGGGTEYPVLLRLAGNRRSTVPLTERHEGLPSEMTYEYYA
jgi:hypothetical protein